MGERTPETAPPTSGARVKVMFTVTAPFNWPWFIQQYRRGDCPAVRSVGSPGPCRPGNQWGRAARSRPARPPLGWRLEIASSVFYGSERWQHSCTAQRSSERLP